MSNPFSGIISTELKNMYTNAIDALLEETALTVPCELYYDTEKYEDCDLCVRDDIGDMGGIPFPGGGSNIFPNNQNSPVSDDTEKRRVEVDPEELDLFVIFNYKKWLSIDRIADVIKSPEGYVQILTKISNTSKLRQAKYIIINTNLSQYANHRFVKDGEPIPLGLGSHAYSLSMWKREA